MLTGFADFKIAVDAFNKGIVDRFLVKDSRFMLEETVREINAMQELFFAKLSYPLFSCLLARKETLFNSREYNTHFERIIIENNIREYYLLNAVGNYLMFNRYGEKLYFIVLLDKEIEEYIDVAINMRADSEFIKKIHARTHAPIFINKSDYKLPVSDWCYLIHPIEKATGYHYCVLS